MGEHKVTDLVFCVPIRVPTKKRGGCFLKEQIRKLMIKMHIRITLLWLVTVMLPIVVFLVTLGTVLGPRGSAYIWDAETVQREVWQMDKWSDSEKIFRNLQFTALKNPEKLLQEEYRQSLREIESSEKLDTLIIIRKEDEITTINDFETQAGEKLAEKFKTIEKPSLPEFGSQTSLNNEELFDKTGYVVKRQIDFYFTDQTEGSIFILNKVVNISAYASKFIIRYFKILLTIVITIMFFIFIHGTHLIVKKLKAIILATHRAKDEDFSYRIKFKGFDMFTILSDQINGMLEALEKGKNERSKLEENRQTFISNLTHDLKTPLTAIKIQVEAIDDGLVTNPEKEKQYMKNIQKKLRDIDNMIEELKVFNELDIGKENYNFYNIDFDSYMRDLIEEFKYEIDSEKTIITYASNSNYEYTQTIDPEKMKRLISNIWSNSLKYVSRETIRIDMYLDRNQESKGECRLIIRDNGNGVAEEELPKIFDQYHRVDSSRNPNISGSGLGLAICKRIVTEHGGNIIARNRAGLEIEINLPPNNQSI